MTVRSSEGIPTYEAVSSRSFQTVSQLDFIQFGCVAQQVGQVGGQSPVAFFGTEMASLVGTSV